MFGDVPESWNKFLIKWTDYVMRGLAVIVILLSLAWFGHSVWYDYLTESLVKEGKTAEQIQALRKFF